MECIENVNLRDKTVLLRCDFNVPTLNGVVLDNSRLKMALETINYLIKNDCKIVIISHMGRIKNENDKKEYSLKIILEELSNVLNKRIEFLDEVDRSDTLKKVREMKSGDIVLLENTRFNDYPNKLESNNDLSLSKYYASLADVFVIDAFASLHRVHASVAGVANYLPTYCGFLVKNELDNLGKLITDIERPYTVFMGASKIDDKVNYIEGLLNKCDYFLAGGGIANSFMKAIGIDNNGVMSNNPETLEKLRRLYENSHSKIILPIDFIYNDGKICDIGAESVNKFQNVCRDSKTFFMNGTPGKFENIEFANGTIGMFDALRESNGFKVAGGGATLNAVSKYDSRDAFSYLSSGGGASLEFVSNDGHLSGLEYIKKLKKERL